MGLGKRSGQPRLESRRRIPFQYFIPFRGLIQGLINVRQQFLSVFVFAGDDQFTEILDQRFQGVLLTHVPGPAVMGLA